MSDHLTRLRPLLECPACQSSALEQKDGRYPQDWHMLQKIWVADLDPAKAPGPEED